MTLPWLDWRIYFASHGGSDRLVSLRDGSSFVEEVTHYTWESRQRMTNPFSWDKYSPTCWERHDGWRSLNDGKHVLRIIDDCELYDDLHLNAIYAIILKRAMDFDLAADWMRDLFKQSPEMEKVERAIANGMVKIVVG